MGARLSPHHRPRSVLLDEDAPEFWVFLDYANDGTVLVLTRFQYEARYRPDPDDHG